MAKVERAKSAAPSSSGESHPFNFCATGKRHRTRSRTHPHAHAHTLCAVKCVVVVRSESAPAAPPTPFSPAMHSPSAAPRGAASAASPSSTCCSPSTRTHAHKPGFTPPRRLTRRGLLTREPEILCPTTFSMTKHLPHFFFSSPQGFHFRT